MEYAVQHGLPEACNPAFPNMINVYSPNGRRLLKEGAVAFGARVADDPSVAGAKLDNEGFFVNRGNFCPDKWADLDFRNWLKRRYENDLAKLNAAWRTSFGKWDDVRQPISGVKDGTIQKTGGAGRGRLRGSDFADVALLTDALTGAQSSLDFSLPAFGYRVFTTGK